MQCAENILALGYFVGHDPQIGLQLVAVSAELVERGDGAVARAIGVMHGGAVHWPAVLPNRELVGNGKGLAVADDHAADAIIGDPGLDPGVHSHPRQADLIARAIGVFIGQRRELFFVGAPAHFGRGGSFLAEAFDAPGIDELVDLLGPIGDLRVALGAMDHLDAQFHRQAVERAVGDELGDFLGIAAGDFFVVQQAAADVDQALAWSNGRSGPGWRRVRARPWGRVRTMPAIMRRMFMCRQ